MYILLVFITHKLTQTNNRSKQLKLMKKNMLTLIFAVVFIALQSCHKISGNGPTISRTYNLTDFTSVYAGLDGDVYYTQDSIYKVEIHAQANIMDMIDAHISNGELQLAYEKYKNVGRHDRVAVYISAPFLNGMGINGSGNLYALQPVRCNNMNLRVNGSGNVNIMQFTGTTLSANISGSGNITVSGGNVNSEDLRISGSGTLDLLNITANSVTTTTSGSGSTTVYAADALNVHISGSGNVYYSGNPSVNSSISGSGKVRHL